MKTTKFSRSGAVIVVGVLLAIAGCAAPGSRIMSEARRSGQWSDAVRLLTTESLQHPTDARIWARLGEAQYRAGQDDAARLSLNKALMLNESLASAHLFLGYIAERGGDIERALWHYQVFVDQRPGGQRARNAARRIAAIRQTQADRFAREAIKNERNLSPASYPDSTIGVVYFRAQQLADSLRPLAKGLAEMTVTDLSKVPALRVVERLKIEKLLEELHLSNTVAFDTTTAPRLGKLLGAAHVLGGNVSTLGRERLRFDPQMVSAKTGEVTLPASQVGELTQFFTMEKKMVFDVIERLGITLTEAQRDSIGRIPTRSLTAFLAYSRGLDAEDHGRYKAAQREFHKAATVDPSFNEAKEQAEQMQYLQGQKIGEPSSLETFSRETSTETEWSAAPGSTNRQLDALLNNTGLIRVGVGTSGTDSGPMTPPATEEASAIIHGHFDD